MKKEYVKKDLVNGLVLNLHMKKIILVKKVGEKNLVKDLHFGEWDIIWDHHLVVLRMGVDALVVVLRMVVFRSVEVPLVEDPKMEVFPSVVVPLVEDPRMVEVQNEYNDELLILLVQMVEDKEVFLVPKIQVLFPTFPSYSSFSSFS